MTKVRFHGSVAGFSGAMGEMVFADNKEKGRTVAYMKSNYMPSEAQLVQHKRLRKAAMYGKMAMADPVRREFYETVEKERDLPAYTLAVMDYFSVPSIEPLDLSYYKGQVGDPVMIQALDDIGLASVAVELIGIDETIEKGNALETGLRSGYWVYTAQTPLPLGAHVSIRVTGLDHTGKTAQITETAIIGAQA